MASQRQGTSQSTPELRWYQYRLRSLLLLMTIWAILCKAGFPLWEEYRHWRQWRQEQQRQRQAISHALAWLLKHQSPANSWSFCVPQPTPKDGPETHEAAMCMSGCWLGGFVAGRRHGPLSASQPGGRPLARSPGGE
ncbi:MAG: hypothetical protein ACLQLG_09705 [Thermoguttaceae bacterium]